jgi:hypothetical protein
VSSQSASEQQSEQRPITLALQAPAVGRLPECLALRYSQPIAEAHSQLLDAFDAANTRRQVGTEETAIGGLVCKTAYRAEAQVDSAGCQLAGFEMRTVP